MLSRRGFLKSIVGAAIAIGTGVAPVTARKVERRLPEWLRHRPLDVSLAEECGRRIAEAVEREIIYGHGGQGPVNFVGAELDAEIIRRATFRLKQLHLVYMPRDFLKSLPSVAIEGETNHISTETPTMQTNG